MDSYQHAYTDRRREAARALAVAIEREITNRKTTLLALAASPHLDTGVGSDLAAFYVHARRAAAAVASPVSLIGPDLQILIDSDRPFEKVPSATAADAAVRAVFTAERFGVSDLQVSPVNRQPVVALTVPVQRHGRVIAAVSTRIAPDELSHLLASPQFSPGTVATLTDSHGVILARSSAAEGFVGQRVPDWYTQAISGQESGLTAGRTLAGEQAEIAFQRVAGIAGWTLTVWDSVSAYRASWRPLIMALLGGGAMVLALALTYAMWLSRRILHPVTALQQQAEAVASGGGAEALALSAQKDRVSPIAELNHLSAAIGRAGAIIAASERRSQRLAEAGAVALWRATADGRIIESRGWEVLTAQNADQLRDNGWLEVVHPDDRPSIQALWRQALAERRPKEFEFRVRVRDGRWVWHRSRAVPILNQQAGITEWLGAIETIHDRKLAEAALSEREARLRAVFETTPECIKIVAPDGRLLEMNSAGLCMVEAASLSDVEGGPVLDMIVPEHRAEWQAKHGRVCRGEALRWEFDIIGLRGTRRHMETHATPLQLPDGRIGHLGITRDITERRAAEERQDLLAREVDHRAKNVLAVVQSVLRLTPAQDVTSFTQAVEARVAALARAHSLLAQGGWVGADLHTIIEKEVAAYCIPETSGTPVSLSGPRLPIAPYAVQSIGMVLHELATNAVKYGALSVPDGRVQVVWRLDQRGETLHLAWVETGGPPVTSPSRRGFGSRLIDATIRGQLGGSVDWGWNPRGLTCSIALPFHRAAVHNMAAAA
ncbi:PAS domain S-box protein [Belnapia moabensis]|uniref:PAS domain S-box protein n=1 Tax=Belnapia moabensis TaxID=365533 RepID=UPI0014708336|nr:PAS domain S-box protein [Belnapia moabensis]